MFAQEAPRHFVGNMGVDVSALNLKMVGSCLRQARMGIWQFQAYVWGAEVLISLFFPEPSSFHSSQKFCSAVPARLH